MARILILNGPNLNFLGRRQAGYYGIKTLDEINQALTAQAQALGNEVTFYQSNVEGELINCIQENWGQIQGIIINPGALTTYGLSLKDALIDSGVPIIEVHLSNIHAREEWRRRSVIADIARGQIAGFGWRSYTAALDLISEIANET
jgi:3-dehydroquinate dehydratase-2